MVTYIESNPNRRERNIDICYTNKILSFVEIEMTFTYVHAKLALNFS